MENAIVALLSGDLSVVTLLLLFILGILTKRFVPWWVYEQTLDELKAYEEDAPKLINKVDALIEEVQRGGHSGNALREAKKTSEAIRRRSEDGRRERPRRKRGDTHEWFP